MKCIYILCMVFIQLAAASYNYNPSELHQLAAYYSMYDIDMPDGLELQLAAAMSRGNLGYQPSRRPHYKQPVQQQQYYQPKPTTRSQYVQRYPNNQQYRNTNTQHYQNTNNQQYRNTNNQQYLNTNNQQYRNVNNHQYRNNQYRNTNNHQYRNTNNQQYRNANTQQYQYPKSQYQNSQQPSRDTQRRGGASVIYQSYTTESFIPTTTQTVPRYETSTSLPVAGLKTVSDTPLGSVPVQKKVQNNNPPPKPSANHQHPPSAYQKPLTKSYNWPSNQRNYQNTYHQRTNPPYNYYPQRSNTNNYQRPNQQYYRTASNSRVTPSGRYFQNNYPSTSQNNYQTQNYNRYYQNNNFLPYMAATDVFDIY